MNDVMLVALAKALEKTAKPIQIAVGEHVINETITLTVQGTVKKGKNHEFTPTVEIPLLTTMALLLEKSGFQRERSKALLIEAMQEALANNADSSEIVAARVRDIEAAMEHVKEVTSALPKKIRNGVTNVNVEIIDVTPVAA